MKNKNYILSALAVLLIASLFALGSTSYSAEKEMENSTCCKQKNSQCPLEKEDPARGDILLDNISRQFISIISF